MLALNFVLILYYFFIILFNVDTPAQDKCAKCLRCLFFQCATFFNKRKR